MKTFMDWLTASERNYTPKESALLVVLRVAIVLGLIANVLFYMLW